MKPVWIETLGTGSFFVDESTGRILGEVKIARESPKDFSIYCALTYPSGIASCYHLGLYTNRLSAKNAVEGV